MWEARLWWWSRIVETATALTLIIANRIPFNSRGVDYQRTLEGMPLYVPWKGDRD